MTISFLRRTMLHGISKTKPQTVQLTVYCEVLNCQCTISAHHSCCWTLLLFAPRDLLWTSRGLHLFSITARWIPTGTKHVILEATSYARVCTAGEAQQFTDRLTRCSSVKWDHRLLWQHRTWNISTLKWCYCAVLITRAHHASPPQLTVLGTFVLTLRNCTKYFRHVCLSVCLSAYNYSRSNELIFMLVDIV
jgi:hypothetical protein